MSAEGAKIGKDLIAPFALSKATRLLTRVA